MSWEYYAVGIEMLGFMAMAIYSGSSDSNYGTSAQDSTNVPVKELITAPPPSNSHPIMWKTEPEQRRSRAETPDDAYNNGYDQGHDQGLEDGINGYNEGDGYDDSSEYYNYYETRYKEGYECGYSDGYIEGKRQYEDENE